MQLTRVRGGQQNREQKQHVLPAAHGSQSPQTSLRNPHSYPEECGPTAARLSSYRLVSFPKFSNEPARRHPVSHFSLQQHRLSGRLFPTPRPGLRSFSHLPPRSFGFNGLCKRPSVGAGPPLVSTSARQHLSLHSVGFSHPLSLPQRDLSLPTRWHWLPRTFLSSARPRHLSPRHMLRSTSPVFILISSFTKGFSGSHF